MELFRFDPPVSRPYLFMVLDGSHHPHKEPTGHHVDLDYVQDVVSRMPESLSGGPERATWDAELIAPLHSTLSGISRRLATDIGFWQWLATEQLQDFVWKRWLGNIPDGPAVALESGSLWQRFLGNQSGKSTLSGMSRQALARLWWCAEILGTEDGYRLARTAVRRQDLYQAVFEREFGLYPPAARACIKFFDGRSENEAREGTRRLNQLLSTLVLETLDEDDIMQMLEEGSQ